MHRFVRELITEWRKLGLPFADETIVVALSGGADSLSLLLAIDDLRTRKKLKLRIVAAHFNHKLRGRESDVDEQFVKQIAADRNLELAVGHGLIAREGNLEQNARNARYAFLAQTAENLRSDYVLTAHTMNDQAETFLLNLIRGSGTDGLGAMRPIRDLRDAGMQGMGDAGIEKKSAERNVTESPLLPFSLSPFLVRPLLSWAKRADTENFCRESGVEFRYDTMNEDMSFKRVRVRKMLLPMLEEFNPKIIETLARTAELMQNSSVRAALAGGEDSNEEPTPCTAELSINELKNLEMKDLHQTVRAWLKARRGSLRSISLKHIEAVAQLIHSTKSGRTAELPGSGFIRKRGGRLIFENIKVDK